jgi:hypothetical protein
MKPLAKILTELYICIPRRSSKGAFQTNVWANLTRKDTGEGVGSKQLRSFLDGVNVSLLYTQAKTGYAGPFDINPKTVGEHVVQIFFDGDAQFESCKSEEVILEVNPTLLGTQMTMQITPVSGHLPLAVKATGTIYKIASDGSKKPASALPLALMVFDGASTKRLEPVGVKSSGSDGTFEISYTFQKSGAYGVFVNFFGDERHISSWSNNGKTTAISVSGGGLPLSFDKTITLTVKETKQFKWFLGQTEPSAPEGYERFSDLDLDFGLLGKYWAFVKAA